MSLFDILGGDSLDMGFSSLGGGGYCGVTCENNVKGETEGCENYVCRNGGCTTSACQSEACTNWACMFLAGNNCANFFKVCDAEALACGASTGDGADRCENGWGSWRAQQEPIDPFG